MKIKDKKKTYDAVAFMRRIRDELSKKYVKNQKAESRDLSEIRKKYGIKNK